jgi:LPS export ABC transporter permease LptG/LPS export ABC transporter permease LptF
MGILGRTLFLEITSNALLGTLLFTFVLFLQQVGKLFVLFVRSSAPPKTIALLFSLILPYVLTFTIPVGVLVGVLIALSRMSSDGEITAMRAAGIPSRKVMYPVMLFAMVGLIATAAATLWLTPLSLRQKNKVVSQLAAEELTADVQPRVFQEQFPNKILFVGDVIPGPVIKWKNVFLADITPAENRKNGTQNGGDGPLITVAAEAIAVPDIKNNRIQLSFINGSTYEADKDWNIYHRTSFPTGDQMLEAERHGEIHPRLVPEMDIGPLYRLSKESLEARIELHQRLALPPACLLLALIGIPLGVSSRKAGKSSAFVLTVAVAFLYWMSLISLLGLAKQGTLPAGIAIWIPNIVTGIIGIILFVRLETPGDRDMIASVQQAFQGLVDRIRGAVRSVPASTAAPKRTGSCFPMVPQIVDRYVLTSFLFYFLLLLVSLVMMTHVYNFFELLSDIVKNHIPMALVGKYLLFLTPKLIYECTPMSVLVGVLITFGILSKNNEVTALKASGVSLYRLGIPVILAGAVLSFALFTFDHYIIPDANVIQDGIRLRIKGKPVQTFLRPDRKWIFGEGNRIYRYNYFEQNEGVMAGVSVYELDPATFRLTKHITAERARWEPGLNTWIFLNGWARQIHHDRDVKYQAFPLQTATFPELKEPPGYFLKEDIQEKQMNFQQLSAYIRELRQSGFDTVHQQVQYHKKFSVPLFALIMAMISVPFAFATGNRGAMASIGVSFGIAIAYWSVSALFEQIGNVNQLPAVLAAWSPDAVFSLAGLYFLARMKT